jgi:hypothetical protein
LAVDAVVANAGLPSALDYALRPGSVP